jgi:small conductance mechanosensitive channel
MEKLYPILDFLKDSLIVWGPKVLMALLTLVLGLWVIRIISRSFGRLMARREVEPSLRSFFRSMISGLLKVLLVVSVIGMVGIEATSFVAIIGAAGLAVGLALSGSLQNFAGGVMILLFKPFKVGDYIDAQGHTGSVKEIQIFNTILKTPDNKTVIIPNGGLSTGSMVNFSTEERRRVDMTFGIGYDDDIDKAKATLMKLIDADSRILKDPAPFLAVSELADSSVNIVVRVWANASDYWGIFFDMQEQVKKEFDRSGISIPFPQTDVHIFKTK